MRKIMASPTCRHRKVYQSLRTRIPRSGFPILTRLREETHRRLLFKPLRDLDSDSEIRDF
jgi:hypothetical protein